MRWGIELRVSDIGAHLAGGTAMRAIVFRSEIMLRFN
jgi:hypothetical protein